MINSKVVFKSPQDCTWIEKFQVTKEPKQRDFFSFCDAIFIITVKKDSWTPYQIDMVKNINILGCQERTYWCFTQGYKKCVLSNTSENMSYNTSLIFEYSLLRNFQNILIIEDDLLITSKIWSNYEEKKKRILKVINNNKDNRLIFHFGQFPLLSIPINKYISRGLNMNAHCIMYNQLAAKEYLNIYYRKKKKKKDLGNTDIFYLLNNSFKKYSLIPNNIFFQKSNPGSNSSIKKFERFCYRSQYFYTGRYYYQYDPKFVSFWEPIRGLNIITIIIIIIFIILISFFIYLLSKK